MTSRLGMANTAKPRTKATITCIRKSHPMVGMVRYPVTYKSRWIAAVAINNPDPTMRRMILGHSGAGRSACSRPVRSAVLPVPSLVILCRPVMSELRRAECDPIRYAVGLCGRVGPNVGTVKPHGAGQHRRAAYSGCLQATCGNAPIGRKDGVRRVLKRVRALAGRALT